MLKKELRLNYLKFRNTLSTQAVQDASLVIANKLLELPIWSLDYYHLFLPIKEKKEVDTGFILTILQGKDKNVVVPKIGGENELQGFLLTDSTILKLNKWNIPEPEDGLLVPADKIDLVFVPLLAFDQFGNRVGYGKGFYDRYLEKCRPDVVKVGLSFFNAEDKITDTISSDIPLNYCVTPEKIYAF